MPVNEVLETWVELRALSLMYDPGLIHGPPFCQHHGCSVSINVEGQKRAVRAWVAERRLQRKQVMQVSLMFCSDREGFWWRTAGGAYADNG